jgi:hypothetical protein
MFLGAKVKAQFRMDTGDDINTCASLLVVVKDRTDAEL